MFNSFLFVNFSIELCQVSSRDGSVRHVVLIYTHSSNGLEVRCISDDFGDLKTATPSDYQWAYLSSHHSSLEFWKAKKEWNNVLSTESSHQFNCRSRYSCIDVTWVTFFQFPPCPLWSECWQQESVVVQCQAAGPLEVRRHVWFVLLLSPWRRQTEL